MAWNGSGTFSRNTGTYTGTTAWSDGEAGGENIDVDRHDTHDQDLATGINLCLTEDGQNVPTTNLSWVHTTHDLGSLSGSSNAYTKTNSPAVSAYATGQIFMVVPNHDNTGASTINLDSLGAKSIKIKCGGAVYDTPEGSLRNGQPALLRYDGTQFLLLNSNIIKRQSAVGDVVSVSNTTSETDLFSFSVLGNTLGIANKLILAADLDLKSGAAPNLTIQVKYGSSSLFTHTYTAIASTGSNYHYGRLDVELSGFGSTSAQYCTSRISFYNDPSTAGTAGQGGNDSIVPYQMHAAADTSAEDSTGNLDFDVTAQWSVADSAHTVRVVNATLKFE